MGKFEDLTEKRKRWVQSNEENGFQDGIEHLLTQLYPDNAHFIYELLQNAEDAHATDVTFDLRRDELIVSHDGTDFSIEDIDSITSLSNSTKSDEGTAIGKFGVGFKSVFSYTSSPCIKSGEYSFKITDLVVPEKLTMSDVVGKTVFKFPFNNPMKSKDAAFTEILTGLKSLPLETLLFLKNIRQITCLYNGEEIFFQREENGKKVVLKSLDGSNNTSLVEYLRFSSADNRIETKKGVESVTVSLAYKLEQKNGAENISSTKIGDKYKIVPRESDKNVFIFFPAEKETSHLKFVINAPFATTVARDSIVADADNSKLVDLLVSLQKESLIFIKEQNLLTTEFLGVLPNKYDDLSDFYEKFRSKIQEMFKKEAFTPTKSGKYAPAADLYSGGKDIQDILTDDDLSKITAKPSSRWVQNAAQQNSRPYRFLDDLEISKWDQEQLDDFFFKCYLPKYKEICMEIFSAKKANVLRSLYKFIVKNDLAYYVYAPIFRLANDEMTNSFGKTLFFPSEDKEAPVPENSLSDEIYKGIDKNKKEDLKQILMQMGVKEYSVKAKMDCILKKYDYADRISQEHIGDVKFILSNLDNFFPNEKQEILSKIKDTEFIAINNEDENGRTYVCPKEVFFSNEKNADVLRKILGRFSISDEYEKKLGRRQFLEFKKLLSELGAHDSLWIEESDFKDNCCYQDARQGKRENSSKVSEDYDFPLQYKNGEYYDLLQSSFNLYDDVNLTLSKEVWKCILRDGKNKTKAKYRANNSDPLADYTAHWVTTLQDIRWLPKKNAAGYYFPAEMTLEDLPDDWEKPKDEYENEVLKAIGFGKNTLAQLQRREDEKQKFESLGLNPERADAYHMLDGMSDEEAKDIRAFMEKLKARRTMPESFSANPERRVNSVKEDYKSSSSKQYEQKVRSVRVSGGTVKEEAKRYLRDAYTDEDNRLHCQICQETMPFKNRKGEDYFEAIEIFSLKEVEYKYLCLCPNCAAEYKEWVKNNEDGKYLTEIKNFIQNNPPRQREGKKEIPVKLNDKETKIYFTGKHYQDLHTLLITDDNEDKDF